MHPRFLSFAVIALLLIGLLALGGSAMQRNAWTQGYLMGQAAASGDGSASAALAPYMAYGHGLGGGLAGPGFGLLACLFPLGLLAFLAFAFGGFFRHKAWRGGPPEHWRQQWHHGAGPCRGEAGKTAEPGNPAGAGGNAPVVPASDPQIPDPSR